MDTLISGLVDSVVVALLHAAEVANLSGAHVIFTAVSISRHTLHNRVGSFYTIFGSFMCPRVIRGYPGVIME